jgi:hypothetical protein
MLSLPRGGTKRCCDPLCHAVCAALVQERSEIVRLCTRMQLSATASSVPGEVIVTVPPFRTDILHECDVVGTWERPSAAPRWFTHAKV